MARKTTNQKKKKRKIPQIPIFLTLSCWGFAAIWIGLIELSSFARSQDSIIQKSLKNVARSVQLFQLSQHRVPVSMQELRLFCIHEHLFFDPNVMYFSLTKDRYVLKSYDNDLSESNLPELPLGRLIDSNADDMHPHWFQEVALEGIDSPNGELHARLFIDPIVASKRLVVRKRSNPNFVAVAPLDRIDEFYWLPSSEKIILSASSNDRYFDGIYIWDFVHDQLTNIIPSFYEKNFGIQNVKVLQYNVAFAGFSKAEQALIAFIQPIESGHAPKSFFDPDHLWMIQIGDEKVRVEKVGDQDLKDFYNSDLNQKRIEITPPNLDVQRDYLNLVREGHPETVTDAWQEFIAHYAKDSAITPYAMFKLGCMYSDLYQKVKNVNQKEAQTVRAFGQEIFKGVIDLPTAPRYLRQVSQQMRFYLKKDKVIPFQFATFEDLGVSK